MRDLNSYEKELLEIIVKKKAHKKSSGYYYFSYKGKWYKRSRVIMQLYLNKILSPFEIVHHKDRNKENDSIENLEILNSSHHSQLDKEKPEGWKPANTIKPEVINRIKEIASEMVKVNCSEIKRRLEREGIKISDFTIGKYLRSICSCS